jgi:biopolymer transport protein ExbD
MLAASFRSSEPVQVEIPTSVSDKIIPSNVIMVTVDKGGRVFFNMTNSEARKELLSNMSGKYKVGFNGKQMEEFGFMERFGCTMKELPGYIDLSSEERGRARTMGIPYDSTNNELKDWIYYGNVAALNTGKTLFEEAKLKGDNPNANDFKPKFILRVDGKTLYVHAQNVIDVFRDLNLNNLNFVTSMEMPPKN